MDMPVTPRGRPDIREIIEADDPSAPGQLLRRILKWAAAIAAGLLLVSAAWWYSTGSSAVRYTTELVMRGDLMVIVTATGSVQPTNKVDVSSELSGTIRKVLVDYNSTVSVGQALAELDTDKLSATVNSARAKVTAAQAKVADAEATVIEKQRSLERKQSLADRKVASIQDLDLAQAEHDRAVASLASARADVGVAEAELALNETELAKACICSPIGGVVLERNVDPGQTVASSFQAPVLFTIAEDLTKMELRVDVDEADVGMVKVGQAASFSVDAFPDRRFPASIRDLRFASETSQGVVTYKAVLDIDNSELLLRPGMTATAEITVAKIEDAVLIPNAALRYSPSTNNASTTRFLDRLVPRPQFRAASRREDSGRDRTVWVMIEGVPTQVDVSTGSSDGKHTEVRGGTLRVGQTVVVDERAGSP